MNRVNRGKFGLFVSAAVAAMVFSGCQKAAPVDPVLQNAVTAGQCPNVNKQIGDYRAVCANSADLVRVGNVSVNSKLDKLSQPLEQNSPSSANQQYASPAPLASASPSPSNPLLVQIPAGLLGEHYVFGAVITKVSDQNDVDLGDLKLTDLPAINVTVGIAKAGDNDYRLVLMGCAENCNEDSEQQMLANFPVVGMDEQNNEVAVDLSSVGKNLDLMTMLDPKGDYTKLKTVKAETTSLDYSTSTLVFDVDSHMIPLTATAGDPAVQETVFTVRWYLKLASAFNSDFVPRAATNGVGFFMTERGASSNITRWSKTTPDGTAPVHYYLKNVPAEWQKAFAGCFDEWNTKLKPVIGHDIFSYEFLDPADPKSAEFVTGDPRYNIVEWDLVNKASYGGLGPSIANQSTGEIFNAHVLIQGPTIMTLYKAWFKIATQASQLRAAGQADAAEKLLVEGRRQLNAVQDALAQPRMRLTFGKNLAFHVRSQDSTVADPYMDRDDFDEVPAGYDFTTYMNGYFHDMLTHELGHNLGLRHNFRGNLGAKDGAPVQSGVSRSVMEYLGRSVRMLDGVGEYDMMALTYGYEGTAPTHLDWFCTDEDQASANAPTASAECSSNDASNDPFSWLQGRLSHAVDLLVARGQATAPAWAATDMTGPLGIAINGILNYATSADAWGAKWTNFYGKLDRPANASGVKAYVLAKFKAQLCDPSLAAEIASKPDVASQTKAQTNLDALRKNVLDTATAWGGVFTASDLQCN